MSRTRQRLSAGVVTTLALLLCVALAPGTGARAATGVGAVTGTVTDGDGDPLAGIEVTFHRYGSVVGQDETDADGVYEVGGLPADTFGYFVRFLDPTGGFATEWYDDEVFQLPPALRAVPVTADTTTPGVDAVLEPAATIGGRLTDATGAPIAGAKVSMWVAEGPGYWGWPQVYSTGATGHYTIDRLKAATYVVELYDPATGIQEFWDDATSLAGATPVVLGSGGSATADAVLGGTIRGVGSPSVTGSPAVGSTLTASPGTWAPSGVALAYRWVVGADTVAADDPTGPTYVPTAADIGKTVRLHVTATAKGWITGSAWSGPTAPVAAPPVAGPAEPTTVQNLVRPRVLGSAKVGRLVRVSPGEWDPVVVTRRYQWFAGGKAIRGSTRRRLFVTPTLLGKRLTVRVRAAAPGRDTVTVWTRPTSRVRR